MKERLLEYLSCPWCGGAIRLDAATESAGVEILEGALQCLSCARRYPITRGIPRFAELGQIESDKARTASSFGWSWQHFSHSHEHYASQFLGWIAPVSPDFFRGKLVLEAGCGKGRHTRLAAGWGAREVFGVDLSEAVEVAFEGTRHLHNVHIVQADIYNLPFRRVFDYGFSVGVLHHLPNPRAGFVSLASRVKPGGHVSAWVYGAENNGWITRWINPLREQITSRLNRRVLLYLSSIPTAILYAATKLVYGPLSRANRGLARRLFYYDYLSAISDFDWREHHSIVFDHLVAPTAFYIPRSEFESWWKEIGATDVTIEWHNKNSWSGWGRIG